MPEWNVVNTENGVILGVVRADNKTDALNMAKLLHGFNVTVRKK